jgi:adenosine deaminase
MLLRSAGLRGAAPPPPRRFGAPARQLNTSPYVNPVETAATGRRSLAKLPLEVIRRLPKAELHQHLDGSVRTSTILDLAREQGVALPATTAETLRPLVTVGATITSLVEYLKAFDIINLVLQKPYALTRIVYEACEDAHKDGVDHLELRFAPVLHTKNGASLSQIMEAVCEGANLASATLNMTVGIIVCSMRHLHPDVSKAMAEVAWRYKGKGVVGYDSAGPEKGFRASQHREAFELIRQHQLGCTVHAGEADDWPSVHDAIHQCGARRLGHAVTLGQDDSLLKYVIDHDIALECCPTSNMQTRAVDQICSHPIWRYYQAGAMVVPCSDNTSVSQITLSNEYQIIQQHLPFSNADLVTMMDYGFRASFLEPVKKRVVRHRALKKMRQVLQEEKTEVEKTPYLQQLGFFRPQTTFWGGSDVTSKRPEAALVDQAPKADLNCRLDESVGTLVPSLLSGICLCLYPVSSLSPLLALYRLLWQLFWE